MTASHVPLLCQFQLFVELTEAAQIQSNLFATTSTNIETKSTELKSILTTWRERLPNAWDGMCILCTVIDISIWDELVAWRQHVFCTINKAYIPLLPMLTANAAGGGPTNSYGYRGCIFFN